MSAKALGSFPSTNNIIKARRVFSSGSGISTMSVLKNSAPKTGQLELTCREDLASLFPAVVSPSLSSDPVHLRALEVPPQPYPDPWLALFPRPHGERRLCFGINLTLGEGP